MQVYDRSVRAVVLGLLLVTLVSACGGKRAAKAETTTAGSAVVANVVGDPFKGKVFFKGYCSGCHTLKAAGATGRLGPDLDRLKPSYARVVEQVTTGGTGGAGLPLSLLTFGPDTFTAAEIRDIAAFVFISTTSERLPGPPRLFEVHRGS